MTHRICFALDLVDDAELIAEYERAHAPGSAWPEITQAIRAMGYEAMEIWRVADRLFMIAEVAEDWPRPIAAELRAADDRWQAAMARFQKPLTIAADGDKWLPMTRIYVLDEQ